MERDEDLVVDLNNCKVTVMDINGNDEIALNFIMDKELMRRLSVAVLKQMQNNNCVNVTRSALSEQRWG